jgi:hypothetical protein
MRTLDARPPDTASARFAPDRQSFTQAAYWLLPPLLCFAIYWRGLTAWFQADDFAWLALRLDVHDWHSLLHALFTPMAQGTIRPWSERAYFLAFESMFGLNALPFRICVFLTQCASLTLLAAVTRRLTGSAAAGLCAAVLWVVNSSLVTAMAWSSAYNQVQCGLFLLGAFWFFLRYIQSGRTSDYVWQWIVFLLGFGALELNVVYPAIAAAYALLLARKYFVATLPLFIPSAAFTLVDRIWAAPQTSGAYVLHFDRALPTTFVTYWQWALISDYLPTSLYGRLESALYVSLTLLLLAFAVLRARRHDWLPVFCLAWFVIVLAPVLPLRDHISDYYLTLPIIGLAILGAYALVRAWSQPGAWRLVAVAAAAAYMITMVRFDRIATSWWNQRSWAVERMVLGVERGHQLHPDKTIVLDGVDSALFWAGIFHHPFRLFGVYNVYLTPGSQNQIEAHDATGHVDGFVLLNGPALHAVKSDRIVVYQVGPDRLKATTSAYEEGAIARLTPDVPRRIDALNPLTDYLFGSEWYPPDGSSHWMPRRATLVIAGPKSPSERLYVQGFISPVQASQPPINLMVTANGRRLPEAGIDLGGSTFEVSYPLANELVGAKEMLVGLEVDRTFHNGADTRELGLNVGVIEIR